jgi:hypothetical protein
MFSHDRLQLNSGAPQTRESSNLLADHVVELEIVRGRARRKRRPVAVPAYLIGRAADCDLVLADERFPEAFAYILVRGQQVLLRHLGFAPALTVNGVVVTQAPLQDGDLLKTGPYEFRVHIRPVEDGHKDSPQVTGGRRLHPETARAVAHTEALAEALDLLRCIRQELLGEESAFRLYLGPEGYLANTPPLATLPVDSAAFLGRCTRQARSA